MGMSESPPPTIIQLREAIEAMRPVCSDPKQIDLCLDLVAWLIETHPSLTARFFLREVTRDAT